MNFNELNIGQLARVRNYGAISKAFQNKLLALGLHRNAPFKVVRRAPLGDPVQVQVHNTSFSVRMQDVATIEVDVLS